MSFKTIHEYVPHLYKCRLLIGNIILLKLKNFNFTKLLFCKKYFILLAVFISLIPEFSWAINVHGLYISSCKRELGVIVNVNDSNVQLLTLKGKVINLPRHEIIYMTYYSIVSFPPALMADAGALEMVKVRTLHKREIVDLVSGWPIDYSKENISFMNFKGHEVVIPRDSIWNIEVNQTPENIRFINEEKYQYNFVHPYPFRYCPDTLDGNNNPTDKPYQVYPKQFLSDPVIMKKELDRLQSGKERIRKYDTSQQFYSVPQVYTNTTSLGYWFSVGSRYGASKSRNNNLAPILIDELSTGPFGYQHLFLTGSAPMPYSIHEEPQTQVYYRLKADYFHLALMFDPNQFLLPSEKYKWGRNDLARFDDRLNQSYSFEAGIDYWHLSLQAYYSIVPFGVRYGENSFFGRASSLRVGATFRNHLFKIVLQYELPGGSDEETEIYNINSGFINAERRNIFRICAYRLNFETQMTDNIKFLYSFIYRTIKYHNSGDASYSRVIYEENKKSLEGKQNELEYQQGYLEDMEGYLEEPPPEMYMGPEQILFSIESTQNRIDNLIEQISSVEEMINDYMAGVPIFESMMFNYNSNSITNAIYLHYSLNHKYTLGCFTALEYHRSKYKNSYSNTKEESANFYPKIGAYASLSF